MEGGREGGRVISSFQWEFLTAFPSLPPASDTASNTALADVFAKFDLSRDGTISIEEYKTLCEEYGVQLTANDIKAIREIADEDGEVTGLGLE